MSAYARNKTPEQRRVDSARWDATKRIAKHNYAVLDRRMGRAPSYVNPFQLYMERHRQNILRHPSWFPTKYRHVMHHRQLAKLTSESVEAVIL